MFTDLFFLYGLAVRIPGFLPSGPGSTPGMGTQLSTVQYLLLLFSNFLLSTEAS